MKRHVRLRQEYLHQRSKQLQAESSQAKRNKLVSSLEANKTVAHSLDPKEARSLYEASKWDDAVSRTVNVDDEYAHAKPPRVCVTTSREPGSKLREFAKEIKLIFPTSVRVNRGQTTLPELVRTAIDADFTDIVLLTEHRGDPDGMIICHLPFGPTLRFSLSDCVTRHDIGKEAAGSVSEQVPRLIFHDFETKLGKRIQSILSHMFPEPKHDSTRVITFYNRDDTVSFRHHVFEVGSTLGKDPEMVKRTRKESMKLREVGPRLEMRAYEIRLGTLDQREGADVEWALRSYINTAKKGALLGKSKEQRALELEQGV